MEFTLRDFGYPVSIARLRALFERSQWYTRDELVHYQEEQLRQTIRHAYLNVPYYRDQFRRLRLSPADIRVVADLAKIPPLSKADLRANFRRLQADNRQRFHPREVRTSGTSGQPLVFLADKPSNVLEFV